jgi:hypothetical protein
MTRCRSESGEWRNGRRRGLKIPCPHGRAGSSPASPTDAIERIWTRSATISTVLPLFPFARCVSVFTGSLLIFGVAWVFVPWIGAGTRLRLLGVGLLWVLLTVLFEIALGRFALGLS